ncbi:MAG: type II toxin-antitoxin system RelB/DinJ family antitoxin [Planctomycetota bacterium]|jgi:DNA-damage-inducible protein J
MGNGTTINVRVDAETKSKVQSILDALGMNVSQAILLFLRQIIFNKGIPFELKIPNEQTMKTIEKSELGKELNEVSSIKELMKELSS